MRRLAALLPSIYLFSPNLFLFQFLLCILLSPFFFVHLFRFFSCFYSLCLNYFLLLFSLSLNYFLSSSLLVFVVFAFFYEMLMFSEFNYMALKLFIIPKLLITAEFECTKGKKTGRRDCKDLFFWFLLQEKGRWKEFSKRCSRCTFIPHTP